MDTHPNVELDPGHKPVVRSYRPLSLAMMIKTLRKRFAGSIEPKLTHSSKPYPYEHSSFSLEPSGARFLSSELSDSALWHPRPVPCYRLPRGKKLSTAKLYVVQGNAYSPAGVQRIYLWPLPMPASKTTAPKLKASPFQHNGRCRPHVAFDFGFSRGNRSLKHWYRWHLTRLDTHERVKYYGVLSKGHADAMKRCSKGKERWACRPFSHGAYTMIGYPPALSSLWMPHVPLGTPLRMTLEAIHPSGAVATTQHIDFRWQSPHLLQKAHFLIHLERIFRTQSVSYLLLLVFLLQVGIIGLWRVLHRRRAEFDDFLQREATEERL